MPSPTSLAPPPARLFPSLALLVVLLAAANGGAQDRFLFVRDERLTGSASGELVKGKTVTLSADVAVIFMSSDTVAGGWKYFPLKDDSGPLLTDDAEVDCPPGLIATPTVTAVRSEIRAGTGFSAGTGKGFVVTCRLRIGTRGDVAPGEYTITVALNGISDTAKVLKASRPLKPPTVTYRVKVYASEEARAETKAAEERERLARVAAEESARKARQEAEEKARREREESDRRESEANYAKMRAANEAAERRRQEALAAERRQTQLRFAGAGVVSLLIPTAVGLYARRRWQSIRPLLAAADGGQKGRPGRLEARLAAGWEPAFGAVVGQARAEVAAVGDGPGWPAAAALAAVEADGPAVAEAARVAAVAAVQSGEVQTRLITAGGTAVYLLAFPDLASGHARALRRHQPFAAGWLAHAAEARARAGADLLALLCFLSADVGTLRLAVAYEAAAGRVASAELVDGDPNAGACPLARVGEWEARLDDPDAGR